MITAKEIKAARDRLGFSQEQFARRLGVDQGTISRWETEGPSARPMVQRFLTQALVDLCGEAAE